MMGMGKKRKEEEVGKEANLPAEKQVASTEQAIAAVRLITLVAMMSVAKGEEQEEEDMESFNAFHWMVAAYTVMVIVATVTVQAVWKVAVRMRQGETEEPQSRKSRSRPNSQRKDCATLLDRGIIPGDAVEGGGDPNQLPEAGEGG